MPEYIYLDYNATTPLLPEVINEIERTLKDSWGNPSSSHTLGKRAKETLETARARVAGLINAGPEEVIFTSGGTESNNLAIIGGAKALKEKGKHLITTRIEHPSVINPFVHLMEEGFEVDFVGPDKNGIVDPQKLATFIRPDTILCSVMLANNETGALQPISEIGKICRKHDILFHTDAAQAVGKIPVDVKEIGVDLLTVAGHKLYAPKGIGALFVRSGVSLERILFGAGQEMGLRAGTEPVPGAAALGMACSLLKEKIHDEMARQAELRELLYEILDSKTENMVRFVPPESCLPNTLAISFYGVTGARLLEQVPKVMASTGAACHDRSVSVSHVLSAMGVDKETALGMVRLSMGLFTTKEEVEEAGRLLAEAASRLRQRG